MFRNLTPHVVRILVPVSVDLPDAVELTAPDGTVGNFLVLDPDTAGAARVSSTDQELPLVDGWCPCSTPAWGPIEGLPAPKDGVTLIVSTLVALRPEVADRTDLRSPATGPKDGAFRTPSKKTDGSPDPAGGQIWAVRKVQRP